MSTPLTQARARVPRLAEAAVERARLTVVPRRATKAPKVPFISLVSLLLVTGVVGLLLFNTHMQQGSFVTTSLEQKATVLQAKEESMKMQLEQLRDPQRLAVRAKRLGMVPATSPAFLRLSDGKVLGNPAPADGTASLRISPLPTQKPASLRPEPVVLELEPPRPEKSRDTARADAHAMVESRTKNRQGEQPLPGRAR